MRAAISAAPARRRWRSRTRWHSALPLDRGCRSAHGGPGFASMPLRTMIRRAPGGTGSTSSAARDRFCGAAHRDRSSAPPKLAASAFRCCASTPARFTSVELNLRQPRELAEPVDRRFRCCSSSPIIVCVCVELRAELRLRPSADRTLRQRGDQHFDRRERILDLVREHLRQLLPGGHFLQIAHLLALADQLLEGEAIAARDPAAQQMRPAATDSSTAAPKPIAEIHLAAIPGRRA